MKIKTSELIGAVDLTDTVCKALRRSWQLGQTYWQQAMSDDERATAAQVPFPMMVDHWRGLTKRAHAATQEGKSHGAA